MTKLLIPEGENLVTYFILPLVNVSIKTFGLRAYKTAYLDEKGLKVYVELRKKMISPIYTTTPYYISTAEIMDKIFVVFEIPPIHLDDVRIFMRGFYSKMSKEAKRKIYVGSGLPYNEKMEDFTVTHPILHCLASTDRMRSFLFLYLNVKELAESGELIDPPDESWFIEHRLKELKTEANGKKIIQRNEQL